MFTGIVQGVAEVIAVEHHRSITKYVIDMPSHLLSDLVVGASVCVDGVCQSVVKIEKTKIFFDAIKETLSCTTIPFFKKGRFVHVERSATIGTEVGGHLLSGHVIGTGTVAKMVNDKEQLILSLDCQHFFMKYIIHKGYIAINGASLTVQEISAPDQFKVHLIPETLRVTTFHTLQKDDRVNIEIDHQTKVIVDTIERILKASS